MAIVRAALEGDSENGAGFAHTAMHQHRVPLGLVMLAQGWITHPQLRNALQAQREGGVEKIGYWLTRAGIVDPEQITRALALQWGCPVLTMDGFAPEAMSLVGPALLAERFGGVPIRVAGTRILYLGFKDKLDASMALALEKMTGLKVESGVVNGEHLDAARERLLRCDPVEVQMKTVEDRDAMAARITAILEQKQPISSRIVHVHEYYWLRLWLEKGCIGKVGTVPKHREDVKDYLFTIGRAG